jgi:hypothetical protein
MAKNCTDAATCGCNCHHCRYGSHCMAHNQGCHLACVLPDQPIVAEVTKKKTRGSAKGRKRGKRW